MTLLFIDTETGGFDDAKHPLIEVAWAVEDGPVQSLILPHDVRACDSRALDVNGYDARHLGHRKRWADRMLIHSFWAALDGMTLVAANPSFDERFLLAYGRAEGLGRLDGKVDIWKHRKIDVEAYAMPILGHTEPKGLATIVEELAAMGAEIPWPDHSARNDVLALRAAYRVLTELAAFPQRWVQRVEA